MRHPKRVLFIERTLRNEKLGIMYLSAALKAAGHHADLIQTDSENLDASIREYRPHFVAFSVTTGEHRHALRTARTVKQRHGIPNIFGGPHCTFFPELGREPDVDFVVQGQGERAIVDIVNGRTPAGFVTATISLPPDALPFPDRGIFYKYRQFRENPMKNVITARACPYKCAYCFNHSQLALTRIDGQTARWFKRRSVGNVTLEINRIRARYPLDKILFVDDSFIQSAHWLDEFLTQHPRDVRLPWLCSTRADRISGRLVERMARAGLEMVNFAIESADPDVQQRLLNRGGITNRHVLRAIALFDRFGLRARMQNMIGLPLVNPLEDALNTLQFNMRHRVMDSWCSIFQPYPRTALGQYCVDHGYTTEDQLYHCADSFFDESRIDIPHRNELHALQKLWYFIVDARLPLDLVQILIRGQYDRQTCDALQGLRFASARRRLYGLDGGHRGRHAQADGDAHAPRPPSSPAAGQTKSISKEPLPRPSPGKGEGVHGTGSDAEALVREALTKAGAMPEFVDIVARVPFAPRELQQLRRHLGGESVYPTPIYTVDDDTGELADPAMSIFMRGTSNPQDADIRRMPAHHFMRRMVEVRAALTAPRRGECPDGRGHSPSQAFCSLGDHQ